MTERSVFVAALELAEPADRAAYLDRACGGDALSHPQFREEGNRWRFPPQGDRAR